jgi:hypothetical protein
VTFVALRPAVGGVPRLVQDPDQRANDLASVARLAVVPVRLVELLAVRRSKGSRRPMIAAAMSVSHGSNSFRRRLLTMVSDHGQYALEHVNVKSVSIPSDRREIGPATRR